MLIFLYGSDSYRRNKKLQELLGAYRRRYKDVDIFSADLDEKPDTWGDVRDFLQQPSMFVSSKVAVVKEGAALNENDWLKTLKLYLDDDKVFIFLSDSQAPKKKFSFLLGSPVKYQKFNELEGACLEMFVTEQFKKHNIRLTQEAKQFFILYLTSHTDRSWLCTNQVAKLALAGFNEPISLQNLRFVVQWSADEEMFFATKKLLTARTLPARLTFLEKLLLRNESSSHVFNLLAYQARGRDASKLANYDVLKKSGKFDDEEALLSFVLS